MTLVTIPYAQSSYDYTVDPESGLATIHDVDLLSVGTWWASTGECTFTEEDLQTFLASLDDPAVKDPRMILGHTDLGPVSMADQMEGFVGEQPVIGKFVNCRLGQNGQTVFAELVGVPVWLAKILPYAYPQRSVEAYFDVTTVTGKHHQMCIPRVAMLGENLPGVATLEDLQVFFSSEGPFGDTEKVAVGQRIAASDRKASMPQPVAASVGYEDVRRSFYESFAEGDRYWWWIRSVYIDPPKLIVDDDEGGLWSVPYTSEGDSVSFGDPVQIFTQYVEVDSGKVAASAAILSGLGGAHAAKSYDSSGASRPEDRASAQNNEEVPVSGIDTDLVKSKLGLSAEATVDEVQKALLEALPDQESDDAPEKEAESPTETASALSSDDSTVKVDKETWEALQSRLSAIESDRQASAKAANDEFVVQCAREGRILRKRVDHLQALMQSDPEGTREHLLSLSKNAVPVSEFGTDDSSEAVQASEYPSEWLSPAERKRAAAFAAGEELDTPLVVKEAN